jgi:hypothetical protein
VSRRLITVPAGSGGSGVLTFTWGSLNGYLGPAGTRTYLAAGGSGSGAQFTVTRSGGGSNSDITSVTVAVGGSGYAVNNILTVTETNAPYDTIEITVLTVG